MNWTSICTLLLIGFMTGVEMKLHFNCASASDCNATAFETCGTGGTCICQNGFYEISEPANANPALNLPINIGCHLTLFYSIPGVCAKNPPCPPRSSCKNDRCICDRPGYEHGLIGVNSGNVNAYEQNCFFGSFVEECVLKKSSALSADQIYHSTCLPPLLVEQGATCRSWKRSYTWDQNRNICYDEHNILLDTAEYRLIWMNLKNRYSFSDTFYNCNGGGPVMAYFCGCRRPGDPSCADVIGSPCHSMLDGKKNDACYVPSHVVCDMSELKCVCEPNTAWDEEAKECHRVAFVGEPCDPNGKPEPIKCQEKANCVPSGGAGSAGICMCVNGTEFNERIKSCLVKLRGSCDMDEDCTYELFCDKGVCQCDQNAGFLFDPVSMECVLQHAEQCETNEGPKCARGSICREDYCQCDELNGFVWSRSDKECRVIYGKECDLDGSGSAVSAKCDSDARLICTSSAMNRIGGVCSCSDRLKYEIAPGQLLGECRIPLNESCTTDEECSSARVCDTSRGEPTCQCDLEGGYVYDPLQNECVAPVGKSCTPASTRCQLGASCKYSREDYSAGWHCGCTHIEIDGLGLINTIWDENVGECRVAVGGTCHLDDNQSYPPLKCATGVGLTCQAFGSQTNCSCADGMKYDRKALKCRVGRHGSCKVPEDCASSEGLTCAMTHGSLLCECDSERGITYDPYTSSCALLLSRKCFLMDGIKCLTGSTCWHKGVCQCDSTLKFVYDEKAKECRVGYGGKCDLDATNSPAHRKCSTDHHNVICRPSGNGKDGVCACINGTNPHKSEPFCQSSVYGPCKFNKNCAGGLYCDVKKDHSMCVCADSVGLIYDHYKKTCVLEVGRKCTLNGKEECVSGALCLDNCECDSSQNLVWNEIDKECSVTIGGRCSIDANQSQPPLKCAASSGLVCKSFGHLDYNICSCEDGKNFDFDSQKCRISLHNPCTASGDCKEGFICDTTQTRPICKCDPRYTIFDPRKSTCATRLGQSCYYDQDCVPGAHCVYKSTGYICECDQDLNLWDTTHDACPMEYGEICDTNSQNLRKCRRYIGLICKPYGNEGTEGICSCQEGLEYSWADQMCNPKVPTVPEVSKVSKVKSRCRTREDCAKGLFCNAWPKPATCECDPDVNLMYDPDLNTCVLPLNKPCTREWRVCTNGAYCSKSRSGEVCKCRKGFQQDSNNPQKCKEMTDQLDVNKPCVIGGAKKCPPKTECRPVDRKNGPTSCFPIVKLPERKSAGSTTAKITSRELNALIFTLYAISQF